MRRPTATLLVLLCSVAIALAAGDVHSMNTASAPSITSLSASTLARSGRLVIHGIGFGRRDSGAVRIGGATAPVTRWSDTSITAYVPEAAPLGPVRVHVAAETGSSNAMPLVVTLRPDGQLAWRFQADALYILQRPDGGLKWIFQAPAFAYGPPSVGPDGTVYVASINTVYALGPGGTLKWRFTDATSQG